MNEPAAGKPVFLLLLLIRVYYLLFFLFHILLPPPRFRSRSVIIHFLWELTRKVLEPTDFFFFGVDDALDTKISVIVRINGNRLRAGGTRI